jgi:hypothetical protein
MRKTIPSNQQPATRRPRCPGGRRCPRTQRGAPPPRPRRTSPRSPAAPAPPARSRWWGRAAAAWSGTGRRRAPRIRHTPLLFVRLVSGVAMVSKTKELESCDGAEGVKNRPSQFWKEPSHASGSSFQLHHATEHTTSPRTHSDPAHTAMKKWRIVILILAFQGESGPPFRSGRGYARLLSPPVPSALPAMRLRFRLWRKRER